ARTYRADPDLCGFMDYLKCRAAETVGAIDVAGPLVLRDLRIRTQRTGADDPSVLCLRRENARRRLSALTPRFECGQHVELVGTLAAAAMSHSGRHEQPHGVGHLLSAHGFQEFVVIVD